MSFGNLSAGNRCVNARATTRTESLLAPLGCLHSVVIQAVERSPVHWTMVSIHAAAKHAEQCNRDRSGPTRTCHLVLCDGLSWSRADESAPIPLAPWRPSLPRSWQIRSMASGSWVPSGARSLADRWSDINELQWQQKCFVGEALSTQQQSQCDSISSPHRLAKSNQEQ